ncbi:hypothetical protein BpHYR1_004114 [Brachionus plicatilis]|uniref:Uncharacterized protein n=1 Tax=Brachionus plicatilis TaxID=10195 RepID=A0A3M7R0P6_BRAPC|nr:hypothetical protein BpHYR1_004114 [Brachionus plicatilis]
MIKLQKKHVFLDLAEYVTRRGHIICDQYPFNSINKIDPIAVDRFKSIQYSRVWLISSSQHTLVPRNKNIWVLVNFSLDPCSFRGFTPFLCIRLCEPNAPAVLVTKSHMQL